MFANDIALTIIVATLLILLLIAGVIITMFLANKKHVQQEVKIAQMQLNYEKELRTVEQEVQEQVLTNISRELHDNIGQLLTFMRIQLESEKLDDPTIAARFEPFDTTLTDTIQQVRLLSYSLNTDKLEQAGLIKAIEQEVVRLEQVKTLSIIFNHESNEPSFDKDRKVMIFRIFQEIINNMLKHAGAKNIKIDLQTKDRFLLVVSDDGKGFQLPEKMPDGKGSGLINMMKRAKLADLELNIQTERGKGSIFTLQYLTTNQST